LLRLCGRCSARCGDGSKRRRAGNRRLGSLSDGKALASSEAGISFKLARRVAGRLRPTRATDQDKSCFLL